MRDWLGITTIETDALGRATKVTDHEGKSIHYEWDALSRRKEMTYPDGSKVDYRYNASGQLAEVTSKTGSIHYNYDLAGRIKERIMPDGIVTSYTADPLGRLTGLTHRKNQEVLDQFRYTYDPAGNITEIDKYRMRAEKDSGLFHYSYDPLGRLTEAISGQGSRQYRYDSLGNRIQSLKGGMETTYSYNAHNQLIRSQCCDTQLGEKVTEYGYDRRGNLTKVLENGIIKKSYTYDATNRMVGAATADGERAEYVYNGFLKRVKRLEELKDPQSSGGIVKEPSRGMRFILDLTRPYHDLLATEGAENQRFIWGNELLMAEGDTSFCYLSDHLGSPIRLLGSGQEEVLAYDEFGVPAVEAGTGLHNPFGFTGYRKDDASGLYYAQAREYSPETGRFFSKDTHWNTVNHIYGDNPVKVDQHQGKLGASIDTYLPDINAIRQSTNLYTYCMDNPILYTDPSGKFAFVLPAIPLIAEVLFDLAVTVSLIVTVNHTINSIQAEEKAKMLIDIPDAADYTTAGSAVLTPEEIGDIAGKYKNKECVEAKNAVVAELDKRNQKYEIIEIRYPFRRGRVISLSREAVLGIGHKDTYISINGYHVGVLYEGLVYCNVHPYGLPIEVWLNDFIGSGYCNVTPSQYQHLKKQYNN